jgi:hypothetical protein
VLDPLRVNCVREEGKGDLRMALDFNITRSSNRIFSDKRNVLHSEVRENSANGL